MIQNTLPKLPTKCLLRHEVVSGFLFELGKLCTNLVFADVGIALFNIRQNLTDEVFIARFFQISPDNRADVVFNFRFQNAKLFSQP